MAKCYICGRPKAAMRCVCGQCAKTLQPMSCEGCRWDGTDSLEEHNGHCMRCIRNRTPIDQYEPKGNGEPHA